MENENDGYPEEGTLHGLLVTVPAESNREFAPVVAMVTLCVTEHVEQDPALTMGMVKGAAQVPEGNTTGSGEGTGVPKERTSIRLTTPPDETEQESRNGGPGGQAPGC